MATDEKRVVSEFQIRMLFVKYLNEEFEKCNSLFGSRKDGSLTDGRKDQTGKASTLGEDMYKYNLDKYVKVYREQNNYKSDITDESIKKEIMSGYNTEKTTDFMCTVLVSAALQSVNKQLKILEDPQVIDEDRVIAFAKELKRFKIKEVNIGDVNNDQFSIGDIALQRLGAEGDGFHLYTIVETKGDNNEIRLITQYAGCPVEKFKGDGELKSSFYTTRINPVDIFLAQLGESSNVKIDRDFADKMKGFDLAFTQLKSAVVSVDKLKAALIDAYSDDGKLSEEEKQSIKSKGKAR
jgi:hypothetical protein